MRVENFCDTLSYMKSDVVTIRLDAELTPLLKEVCARTGRTRSEVVRTALKAHLAQVRFESLRRRVMRHAEARGYLLDEDVFRDVS
jgi:predicted transcriptional regulator